MLRTIHMMSSSDSRLKVMAMSLLCDGCSLLTDEGTLCSLQRCGSGRGYLMLNFYSADVLLPLVHKIWSPLLARMQDRNPAVVEKVSGGL